MNNRLMNLEMFGNFGKDFFTNAFNEAYNISEGDTEVSNTSSEAVESTESVSNVEVEQIPSEEEKTPVEPPKPSKEEVEKLYKEYFGEIENTPAHQEPQLDEETKSALELYKYLEENPHLVQAMRDVDSEGYQKLNNYVPDELTKKVKEMEEYIQEQQYNSYIKDLKTKYEDFDEDKVVQFAESKDIYDLEIAYKALKADSIKVPNEQELREQIKKEILAELKQNSLSTQSIIGGIDQSSKPTEVNLSAKERRIAEAMGMSAEEYAKWR